jgi:hypothetical protein
VVVMIKLAIFLCVIASGNCNTVENVKPFKTFKACTRGADKILKAEDTLRKSGFRIVGVACGLDQADEGS